MPVVMLGPFGSGLKDGVAPFNTSGLCNDSSDTRLSGEDCGAANKVVRTQELASHTWSVTADSYAPGQSNLTDVILEQTLLPSTHAVVDFEKIPVPCTAAGGGGLNPASSITENPDGSLSLLCNLGEFNEGEQKSVTVSVKISGESRNGASYVSKQRVYSLDSSGQANAQEGQTADVGPILISARPAFDLVHSLSPTQSMYGGYIGKRDVGQGLESGFYTYMYLRMTAASRSGIESLQQPFSFRNEIRAFADSELGTPYALEFYVTECRDNTARWGAEVYGSMAYDPGFDAGSFAYHVANSGSCTYTRDTPADKTSGGFSVQIAGVDFSGAHYPTRTFNNTDLSAGPYYAMSHRVQIWVPFRSIDQVDGALDNQGAVYLQSSLEEFDPLSVSGVSNYADDVEPGYNGALINGQRSNNLITGSLNLVSGGNFSNHDLLSVNDLGNNPVALVADSNVWAHSGQGEREPGQYLVRYTTFQNTGTADLSHPVSCDIFDNTTLLLTDRANTGGSAGTYAYVGAASNNGFDASLYQLEYAHLDLAGDDPLDADQDGQPDYNTTTGRYQGNWSAARSARCEDEAPAGGWKLDPQQVPGGPDAVNAVRARLKDTALAAGRTLEPGQDLRLIVPLQVREQFYSGPHAGEAIPAGTVLAGFAGVRADEWYPDWTQRRYQPAPENAYVDGDRATLTRLNLSLESATLSPLSMPDQTVSSLAGEPIIWQLNHAVQSGSQQKPVAYQVVVIDVLPPEVTFNAECTAQQSGGTLPAVVDHDTDANGNAAPGYTRLTWNLGDVAANETIPPRIFCTDTDAMTAHGTVITNYAEIRADNVFTALDTRSDQHSVVLEQAGSIQVSRTVDKILDLPNDTQVHALVWSNFSNSFTINQPVMIDIFPFMSGGGDGAGSLSPRTPASAFSGAYTLTGAPSVTWLDGSVPDTASGELGLWRYTADAPSTINHDPDNNQSQWCQEGEFGQAGCPANFAAVTAIRFEAHYDLAVFGSPQQGMRVQYTVQAGHPVDAWAAEANRPGDAYTSRFTFDSSSLPPEQFLRSNSVTVKVVAFSLGDFLFLDWNRNGVFDSSMDSPAPDHVPVELYDGNGRQVATTLTGELGPGRYLFDHLAPGDYYLQIPATAFQSGGLLAGWQAALTSSNGAENDDLNESSDQHGYASGLVSEQGVRTGLLQLEIQAGTPDSLPQGNEPLNDNWGRLLIRPKIIFPI
ncbi:MAG: SdrD B-like domain-containing protein [Thiolinea sp.]